MWQRLTIVIEAHLRLIPTLALDAVQQCLGLAQDHFLPDIR